MPAQTNNQNIVLWVEDNQPLIEARKPSIEKLLAKYECVLEVRYQLATATEFLKHSADRVAAVILDLDIPEDGRHVGHPGAQVRPTGLKLIEAYGWLPFIVFSGHAELESQFPHPMPTPLAWLEKGGNPDDLGKYLEHILNLQFAAREAETLARDAAQREQRTLACLRFVLPPFTEPVMTGVPLVPWEALSLLQADDLARECVRNWGGLYIGWAGINLYLEFPGAGNDPDHVQSALSAICEIWQRSHGPRGERLRWNQWFIPPFSAGLLPNHVNLSERIRPDQPALHALGRPGEVAARIAQALPPGNVGVIEAWLAPGSRGAAAFAKLGTHPTHRLVTLPHSTAPVNLAYKPIPKSAAHHG